MNCTTRQDVPFSYFYMRDGRFSNCDGEIQGVSIWFNKSSSALANCDCVVGFGADPDIAGPGVIASFIATAFITLIVTLINLICTMALSCKEQLSKVPDPTDNKKDKIRLLLTNYHLATDLPWLATEHRHPLETLELVMSKSPQPIPWILGFLAYPIIRLFSKDHPKAKRFAELALDILCDIQVLTGLAIITSGLVQLDNMTYYHQQFVINYWFLALGSFWAARSGALNKVEKVEKVNIDEEEDEEEEEEREQQGEVKGWHYWTRTIAIFCCLVLSAVYQVIATLGQEKDWNPVAEGKCYIDHDKSRSEVQYVWLAGTVIYASFLGLVIFIGLIWRDSKTVNKLVDDTEKHNKQFRVNLRTLRNDRIENIPRFFQSLVYLLFTIILITHYFFTLIFDIVAWGNPRSILVVAFYFGSAGWNMYNIIDIKISNRELVGKEETGWGFGQCLAVGLLGLVVLNCGDAWREAKREARDQEQSQKKRNS